MSDVSGYTGNCSEAMKMNWLVSDKNIKPICSTGKLYLHPDHPVY